MLDLWITTFGRDKYTDDYRTSLIELTEDKFGNSVVQTSEKAKLLM